MHIKFIRKHPEQFDEGLISRGLKPMSADILVIDERHRASVTKLQILKNRRNELSKSIGDNNRWSL